jgi:hypothetical protein
MPSGLDIGLDISLDLNLGSPFNPASLYEKPFVSPCLDLYLILYLTSALDLVLVLAIVVVWFASFRLRQYCELGIHISSHNSTQSELVGSRKSVSIGWLIWLRLAWLIRLDSNHKLFKEALRAELYEPLTMSSNSSRPRTSWHSPSDIQEFCCRALCRRACWKASLLSSLFQYGSHSEQLEWTQPSLLLFLTVLSRRDVALLCALSLNRPCGSWPWRLLLCCRYILLLVPSDQAVLPVACSIRSLHLRILFLPLVLLLC